MMSKVVALFSPSLRGGGAERAMVIFAEGLLELGLNVDLLVASSDGPLLKLLPPRVNLIDFNRRDVSSCLLPLAAYLFKSRPQVLFSTICNANVVAAFARVMTGGRSKLVIRESIAPISDNKSTWKRKVIHAAAGWAYTFADGIIAVSEGVAAELCQMNPRLSARISVLPTPVFSSSLLAGANTTPAHPWFEDRNSKVLLAVGRLHPQKGFDVLLAAFAKVLRQKPARLLILGQGPMRDELEAQAHRLGIDAFVSMPGYVKNPLPYFNASDAFVLSSRYEGMPNVLLQALAAGLPVVSTDCRSGPRECLEDGKWGQLVPVDDEDALATGILAALDRPRSDDIARYVRKRYDAREAARAYLEQGGVMV